MSYTTVVQADNPFLWWRFNDASPAAEAADSSSNGTRTGTIASPGSTQYQQPGLITEVGQTSIGAIDNQTFAIASDTVWSFSAAAFSLEWWGTVVPLATLQNFFALSTGGDAIEVLCNDNTGAAFIQPGFANASITTAAGFFETTGRHHYVLTVSGTTFKMYKDGALVVNQVLAFAIAGSINSVAFGSLVALGNPPPGNYGGDTDELAVYDTALTQVQVSAHYAAGVGAVAGADWIPPDSPPFVFPPDTSDEIGKVGGTAPQPNIEPSYPFPPSFPDRVVGATPYTDAVTALAPKIWYRFNEAGGATIVDEMGFSDATEATPGSTQYDQPGLITELNQFSQGSVDNLLSRITTNVAPDISIATFTIVWWTAVVPLQIGQNTLAITVGGGGSTLLTSCFDGTGVMAIGLVGGIPVFTSGAGVFAASGNMYAMVFNGFNIDVYKNGVLIGSPAQPAMGGSGLVGQVEFGGGISFAPLPVTSRFGGFVDELAMFPSLLTAPQLLALYNAGVQAINPRTIPGNENQSGVGGIAVPNNIQPSPFPLTPAGSGAQTFTPASPPAIPRYYQDGYTTQDAINTLFKIVSPRPGSGS